MSFREKSAWIRLVSILLVTLIFFLHNPIRSLQPEPSAFYFHVLVLCIAFLIAIVVIAHIVVAVFAPRDAMTPKDERERLIELKATRVAYYVFVVSAFLCATSIHLGANMIALAYGILFSFVLAEIASFIATIFYFRRGV